MSVKDEIKYYAKRLLKGATLKSIRQRDDKVCYSQFDEHKCIFVHVPKNAGISVAKSLLGKRIGHLSALDYRMVFGKKDFYSYFKFTFTRNPFTRLVSAYEFMQNGGYGEEDKDVVAIVKKYPDFQSFVLNYLSPATAKAIRHFRPQYYFICDSDYKIMVDYVGKFENIENDYEYIRGKIGTSRKLEKMNVTKNKKMTKEDYYANKDVVEKVKKIYKKDFELFGYDDDFKTA